MPKILKPKAIKKSAVGKPKIIIAKVREKEEKLKADIKKAAVPISLKEEKGDRYWEAVGRRKKSVARVRLFTKGGREFLINNKSFKEYFPTLELQQIVTSALEKMNVLDKLRILIKVKGGGYHSQAEAVRHAISRALVKFNQNFRKKLKKAGYLTRDPRMRERKKFGLKRARRAPQWSKR